MVYDMGLSQAFYSMKCAATSDCDAKGNLERDTVSDGVPFKNSLEVNRAPSVLRGLLHSSQGFLQMC
jgi:hypothetical protein